MIINEGGCIDTSECYTINNVGIASIHKNQIEIYPNPTESNIHFKANYQIENIAVFDLTGKEMVSIPNFNQLQGDIDLADFEPGIYLIKIQTNQGATSKKIIKK